MFKTWKEIKDEIEKQGVKDDSHVDYIDINCFDMIVVVYDEIDKSFSVESS